MNNEIKECKYFVPNCECADNCNLNGGWCKDHSHCYYKQLLAEQAKNKKLLEALEDIELELKTIKKNLITITMG